MSCILRIIGKDLDPDLLVAETGLQPYKLFRRGEPRFRSKPKGKIHEFSGIAVEVSVADFDEFNRQKDDAIKFLSENNTGLSRIVRVPGVEFTCLDFGVEYNVTFQSYRLPIVLLKLSGELNIEIEISVYPGNEIE